MEKINPIDTALWADYEKTHFIVQSTPEFVLKIGQYSEELKQLFIHRSLSTAAFITAYNPFSQQLPDDENLERQENS